MRINIKTNGPVKDNDIRALYLLREAMRIIEKLMPIAERTIYNRNEFLEIKESWEQFKKENDL